LVLTAFGPLEEKRGIIVGGEANSWLKKLGFLPEVKPKTKGNTIKGSIQNRFTILQFF